MTFADFLSRINARIAAYLVQDEEPPADLVALQADAITIDRGGAEGGSVSSEATSWIPGFRSTTNLASSGILMAASETRKAWSIPNTTEVNVYGRYGSTPVTAVPGGFDMLIPPGAQLDASGAIAKLEVRVIAPGAIANLAFTEGF